MTWGLRGKSSPFQLTLWVHLDGNYEVNCVSGCAMCVWMCMWEWIGAGWQKGSCQRLRMAEKMQKRGRPVAWRLGSGLGLFWLRGYLFSSELITSRSLTGGLNYFQELPRIPQGGPECEGKGVGFFSLAWLMVVICHHADSPSCFSVKWSFCWVFEWSARYTHIIKTLAWGEKITLYCMSNCILPKIRGDNFKHNIYTDFSL